MSLTNKKLDKSGFDETEFLKMPNPDLPSCHD